MSRISRLTLVVVLAVFMLACRLVTGPIDSVKNTANTAQAIATEAISLATQAAPLGTLIADPSAIPDFENFFDPQGAPVAEWNGIPVMPQATTGQEFNSNTYSFKANATAQEAQDFYNEQMINLGWSHTISMPGDAEGAILVFSKESRIATITITTVEGSLVVLLNLS